MLCPLALVLIIAALSMSPARAANVRDWRTAVHLRLDQFRSDNQERLDRFYAGTLRSALPTPAGGRRPARRHRLGLEMIPPPPPGPGPAPAPDRPDEPVLELPERVMQAAAMQALEEVWRVARRWR